LINLQVTLALFKSLKILQLIQKPQLRGAEIFASQLANLLLEEGHEVHLVSLLRGTSVLPFKGKHIELNRPLAKRFFDWQGWKQLAQEIKTFQPDVVQANAGDTLKYAVLSKLFFLWKAPIVFRNANKVSDFITSKPKLWFNRFLVNRVDHVISVSELCRLDFITTYSYNPAKTTTIPIGIETGLVQHELAEDVKPIFKSGRVLLHAASFVPEKNHEGLLRILQRIVAVHKDVRLVLVGDGRLRSRVEEQLKEMELTNHVHVLGYRKDVMSLMRHAHAFVLPSLIEGLPGVILEAMYCRTPVVAYDVGGVSEVVKNGETGWLVEKGDENGFVKAVEEVLSCSPEGLKRITNQAYQQVVEQYDNKVIAKRFEEVYRLLRR
jgi:glycosyltransferase involved in cell wall biosynthesis